MALGVETNMTSLALTFRGLFSERAGDLCSALSIDPTVSMQPTEVGFEFLPDLISTDFSTGGDIVVLISVNFFSESSDRDCSLDPENESLSGNGDDLLLYCRARRILTP